jgi:ribonuclease BN (tRNA processing enzyme)
VAIVVNNTAYLVDAGAGVMRRAEAARRAGVEALAARRIGVVFLTHLHSDHTIGLPDVMLTGWVAERSAPLRLFGPQGTAAMARHLTEAYGADIANRRGGLQPHSDSGWVVLAKDIGRGEVYRDSNVTVTAIAVPHDGWGSALGYKFVTRDRVIVVSGDTRPAEALVAACQGCDVLVHEVYSTRGFATRSPEWQKYHADAHTSSAELAALATRARPRLLLLYHQLHMGVSDAELLDEVKKGYAGEVISGRDLGIY